MSNARPEAVLVDTDVYSYLMNGGNYAELYRPHVDGKLLAVSFVTVGELYYRAYKRGWKPERIADLKDRLRSATIVPYDEELCRTYARIKAEMAKGGKSISPNDLWIASCAVRHTIPLISNNRKHFESVPGLVLHSESRAMAEIQSQLSFPAAEAAPDRKAKKPSPRRP